MKRSDSILANFYYQKVPKLPKFQGDKKSSQVNIPGVTDFVMPRAASDNTSRVFYNPITKQRVSTATTGQKKEDVATSTKAMGNYRKAEKEEEKQRVAERKSATATIDENKPFTFPTGETKTWNDMNFRERGYVTGKALEQRFRFNKDEEAWYDEFNPFNFIGNVAGGLGTAPYEAKQSNSNLPYLFAIGTPLIEGALGFDPLGGGMKLSRNLAKKLKVPSNTAPKAPSVLKTADDEVSNEFLDLTDEEMEQAMREIEEANLNPDDLTLNMNPTEEQIAERTRLKNMFNKFFDPNAPEITAEEYKRQKLQQQAGDILRKEGQPDPRSGGAYKAPKFPGNYSVEDGDLVFRHPTFGDEIARIDPADYINFKTPELYKQALGQLSEQNRYYLKKLIDQRNAGLKSARLIGEYGKVEAPNPKLLSLDPSTIKALAKRGEDPFTDFQMFQKDFLGNRYNLSDIEPNELTPITKQFLRNPKSDYFMLTPNKYGGDTSMAYGGPMVRYMAGKMTGPNIFNRGGMITDSRGQWAHPGMNTRIPGGNITMQGVPYPVLAKASNGQTTIMQPGQDYNFPGADYVDEYPMMQKGGRVPIYTDNPNDPRLKAFNDSTAAYNTGEGLYKFGKGIYDLVRSPINKEFRKNHNIVKVNYNKVPYPHTNIYPIETYDERYPLKPQSWKQKLLGDDRPDYYIDANGKAWNALGAGWSRFKKPVQPVIYSPKQGGKPVYSLEKRNTFVPKPEPKLKGKVSKVEKLPMGQSSKGVERELIERQMPNIQSPSKIDMGKYKVDYFDPSEGTDVQGGWQTRSFRSEKEASDFMKQRSADNKFYGPSMTQRVEYNNGGLVKYQQKGEVTDVVANEAKAKEFLKNWYTGRAELPQFEDVATARLKTLNDLNYKFGSGSDNKAKDQIAYFPAEGGKDIYLTDPNDPDFNANGLAILPEVIAHEYTHALDYNNPQYNRGFFKPVSNKVAGLDPAMRNWMTNMQAVKNINEKGKPLLELIHPSGHIPGNPDKLRAQANPEAAGVMTMFRMAEGIDPKQIWDEKNIMPYIDKYNAKPYINDRTKENYTPYLIQTWMKQFGNNPKVIANMLNKYVKNDNTQNSDMAKDGGLVKYQQKGEVKYPIDLRLSQFRKPGSFFTGYGFSQNPVPNVNVHGVGAYGEGNVNDRMRLSGNVNSASVFYPGGNRMFMNPSVNVGMKYRFQKGGGLTKYQTKGQVNIPGITDFVMPRNQASSTAVVKAIPSPLTKITTDSADDTYQSEIADSNNFLTRWYRGRVNDPRYGIVAKNRITEIPKIKIKELSQEQLDKENANAYYIPGGKDIYLNPDNPMSRKASTQVHEKTHELYDNFPQSNQDDIIKSLVVPEKNWVPTIPNLDPKYGYNYFSDPTEVAARLNVFRRRFGLDPRKKYSEYEMKKIMDDFNSMENHEYNWDMNQQSGHSNIKDLFNIIGNDPKKLAELNDRIVMNQKSKGADVARFGGDISIPNVYPNQMVPRFDDGGESDPNQPYHPITNPGGYRQQNTLEKVKKLPNKEKRYEPTDAVKNLKTILAGTSIASLGNPFTQYLAQVAGGTGDLYTAARYAADGQYKKAGEDALQGVIGFIPYAKAVSGLKGDYFTKGAKLFNDWLKRAQTASDIKTFSESPTPNYPIHKMGGGYFPPYHSYAPPRMSGGGWLEKYQDGQQVDYGMVGPELPAEYNTVGPEIPPQYQAKQPEYTGSSIVDYLRSKGYNTDKSFRRDLAQEYGVEDYDFSGGKNLELLRTIQENPSLLNEIQPSSAPVDIERIVPKKKAPSPKMVDRETANAVFNVASISFTPNYGKPKPFLGLTGSMPRTPKRKTSTTTSVVTPAPVRKPRIERVMEVDRPMIEQIDNQFRAPLQPVVTPEVAPNYFPALPGQISSKKLSGRKPAYGDSFFEQMFSPLSPLGGLAQVGEKAFDAASYYGTLGKNYIKRKMDLLTGDDPSKTKSKIKIPKKPSDPQARIEERYMTPPVVTGDTILDPDRGNRFYHLPEMIDLDQVNMGYRNRGQAGSTADAKGNTKTKGLIITPFATEYATKQDDNIGTNTIRKYNDNEIVDNQLYGGVDNKGKFHLDFGKNLRGKNLNMADFRFLDIKGFAKDKSGKIILGDETSNDLIAKVPHVLTADGKEKPLNLLIPKKGVKQEETYGTTTGGRLILTTPDFKKKILVSGSLTNINDAIEDFKKTYKTNVVRVVILDNGTYARGLRTKDQVLKKKDFDMYDKSNDKGGAGFYYYKSGGWLDSYK